MVDVGTLKQITALMRDLAFRELDKDEEFKKMSPADQDCVVYSIFNHGTENQLGILNEIHGVEIEFSHRETVTTPPTKGGRIMIEKAFIFSAIGLVTSIGIFCFFLDKLLTYIF